MYEQDGGVELCEEVHTGDSRFQPIIDMLTSEGSTLTLLTFSSLYGFMFELNVTTRNAMYQEFDTLIDGRRSIPVTSYILKFAVISPTSDSLPVFNDKIKNSETKSKFESEARIQQTAWERSITWGRQAICPSVANLKFFDNNSSRLLLRGLIHKTSQEESKSPDSFESIMKRIFRYRYRNTNITASTVLTYFLTLVRSNTKYTIGIMVMPKIQKSLTYYAFKKTLQKEKGSFYGKPVGDDDIENVKLKIVSKVLRLFLDSGVIHFDLHDNNILVYYSTHTNSFEVLLIDFGRASEIITNKNTDDYLNAPAKEQLIGMRLAFLNNPDSVNLKSFLSITIHRENHLPFKIYKGLDDIYEINKLYIKSLLINEMHEQNGTLGSQAIKSRKKRTIFDPNAYQTEDEYVIGDEDEDDDEDNDEDAHKQKKLKKNDCVVGGKTQKRKYKKLIRFSTTKQFKPNRSIKIRLKIKNERRKTNKTIPRRKMQRTRSKRI